MPFASLTSFWNTKITFEYLRPNVLPSVSHLQLLYDKESDRIAFKPCDEKTPGAYPLRGAKGISQVSGTAFLKYNGIPFAEGTRPFPAVWSDGMLIISLS